MHKGGLEHMCQQLLQEIEYTRKQMETLATSLPFSSEQVIEISKQLDKLLNKYEMVIKSK